jgi:hypothetical protein
MKKVGKLDHFHTTVEKLRAIRSMVGLSAKDMSMLLGWGVNQWRLYENGAVPNRSHETMIHVIRKPSGALWLLKGLSSSIVNKLGIPKYNKAKKSMEIKVRKIDKRVESYKDILELDYALTGNSVTITHC